MTAVVEPPPWLAHLGRDDRGFLIPAEAPWIGGEPRFADKSDPLSVVLSATRSCAVCGYRMPPGRPVFRVFAQGDAAQIRLYEREFAEDFNSPGHRSCMLYSAMVCPQMASPTSRLAKDSGVQPGARRGSKAAVMGFADYGILMYGEDHVAGTDDSPPIHHAYLGLVEDLPYGDGAELEVMYREAVEQDAPHVDTARAPHYWTGSSADSARFQREFRQIVKRLSGTKPEAGVVLRGEPYDLLRPFIA